MCVCPSQLPPITVGHVQRRTQACNWRQVQRQEITNHNSMLSYSKREPDTLLLRVERSLGRTENDVWTISKCCFTKSLEVNISQKHKGERCDFQAWQLLPLEGGPWLQPIALRTVPLGPARELL